LTDHWLRGCNPQRPPASGPGSRGTLKRQQIPEYYAYGALNLDPPETSQGIFRGCPGVSSLAFGRPRAKHNCRSLPGSDQLVCGRVDNFTDALPDEVFYALCFLMDGAHTRLKNELRADRTYATAARCFLELIEDKKRRFSASDERQRSG
jgi:hypothetical protein